MPAPPTRATDFVVVTRVVRDGQKTVLTQSTTYFAGSLVYDQLRDRSQEICVLDVEQLQFELLSPSSRTRLAISTDAVLRFGAEVRAKASRSSVPLMQFAASPKLIVHFDSANNRLKLTSPHLSYEVQTLAAPSAEVAQRYRDFADWYARLNQLWSPLPIEPRLELNRQLFRRGLIPVTVRLTLKQDGRVLDDRRAEHQYSWSLSDEDRRAVQRLQQLRQRYRSVGFDEFRLFRAERDQPSHGS